MAGLAWQYQAASSQDSTTLLIPALTNTTDTLRRIKVGLDLKDTEDYISEKLKLCLQDFSPIAFMKYFDLFANEKGFIPVQTKFTRKQTGEYLSIVIIQMSGSGGIGCGARTFWSGEHSESKTGSLSLTNLNNLCLSSSDKTVSDKRPLRGLE